MKPYFLLFLFWSFSVFAQTDIFNVEIIKTNDSSYELDFYKLEHYSKFFYEDDNYTVTTECHGEFGGEVYFKNKNDNTVTVASATCSVVINKLNSKYYLTASLPHLSGFYNIYEIDDPTELLTKTNDSVFHNVGDSRSGMKLLSAYADKTIVLSFVYKLKLYHIVYDTFANESYIAVTEKAYLKKIQKLNNWPIVITNNVKITKNGHNAALFYIKEGNWLRSCYIDVFENQIKIYLCK